MYENRDLIFTDNYEYRGGLQVLVDFVDSKYQNGVSKIITIASRNFKSDKKSLLTINFPLHFIYLVRIILFPILSRKELKKASKVIVISANPLLAMLIPLFNRNVILWYATSFISESMHKSFRNLNIRDKIVLLFNYLLFPIYFLLEKLILQNRKIKVFALSKKTAEIHNIKRKISVFYFPLEKFWSKKSKTEKTGVISVGRFNDSRKDLRTLLRTAIILKDTKFTVIGKLPNNFNKKKYKNIHFLCELSTRQEIKKYYDRAKVFYLPSKQEGLGIVYLEAMACGLPVVTMKNGGAEDLIINEYNGFLLEIGDFQGAAKNINRLLNNKIIYDKLSFNASHDALKFSSLNYPF